MMNPRMRLDLHRAATLRSKLVAIIFCFLVLVVLLVFFLVHAQQNRLLRTQWADSLHAQARLLAQNSRGALAFHDRREARQLLASLAGNQAIVAGRTLVDGKVWAEFQRDPLSPQTFPVTVEPTLILDGHMLVREPVQLADNEVPVAEIELLASLDSFHSTMNAVREETLLLLLAAFLLLLLLSRWVVAWLTDPLERLNRLVNAVSADPGLTERVVIRSRDEIGNLGQALNAMLDRLQSRERELAEYRNHLEQLVHQRTAALEKVTEQARAASQAKSSFLAHMSHEIRTPMNAIIGLSRMLQDSPASAQQRQWVEQMIQASELLLGIINDILDYSKIEAGCLTLDQRPFSLQASLQSLVGIFSMVVREKGIGLRLEIAPDVPAQLAGDPLRLQQILINLVGNAIKFTSQGEVCVRVQRQPMRGEGIELLFSVQDTGIGIGEEQQGVLFSPFTQADSSITRRFGGTGLGLAICRQLVELMGGSIWLQSRPGMGSTFSFTARFAEARGELPVAGAGVQRPSPLWRGERVLLVEDVPLNRTIAIAMLERFGLRIDTASNGEEALQLLTSMPDTDPYRLVLMDIQMPVLDGLTATRRLRLDPRLQQLPVIAMTAHGMEEDRRLSLEAGMNDHLVKPILVETLQAVLQQWLPPARHVAAPAPAPASTLLAQGGVIDVARGLQLHMQDQALYLRSLHTFARDFAAMPGQIRDHVQAGDWSAARRLAHSLRSTSASIGADTLSGHAQALEQGLIHGQVAACLPPLTAVEGELVQVLACVAAMPPPAASPAAGLSAAALQARLYRLLQLADAGCGEAWQQWSRQLAQEAPPDVMQQVAAIGAAIDDVEYEQALAMLEQFCDTAGDDR